MKYLLIIIGFLLVLYIGKWIVDYMMGEKRKTKKIFPDDKRMIKRAMKKR